VGPAEEVVDDVELAGPPLYVPLELSSAGYLLIAEGLPLNISTIICASLEIFGFPLSMR
jgi:hypothetical protein